MNNYATEQYRQIALTFVGDMIGSGVARDVYACLSDDSVVVKVEARSRSFQNIKEYEVWEEVRDTKFAKLFAPCVSISPDGSVLIQKRAEPARRSDLPKKVPKFWGDLKKENFGFIKGKLVCVDYGYFPIGLALSGKTRKANWWSQ